jgi:hypothetical protein
MLSLERSKAILNKADRKYTDDEIKRIREVMNILAELEFDIFSLEKQSVIKKQHLKTKNKKL